MNSQFYVKLQVRRGLRALHLGRMSEMQVPSSASWSLSEAEMRVTTLASWYYSGAETWLLSSATWLLRRGFQPSHLDATPVAVPFYIWSLDSAF